MGRPCPRVGQPRTSRPGRPCPSGRRHRVRACPGHLRSMRVSAEHHAGVRAVGRHRPKVGTCIVGTGWRAAAEVVAGRMVDRVHPDETPAEVRAQRVDENLPDPADTGRLSGAASENHLDVGTGDRRRARGSRQCEGDDARQFGRRHRVPATAGMHSFSPYPLVVRAPADVTPTDVRVKSIIS